MFNLLKLSIKQEIVCKKKTMVSKDFHEDIFTIRFVYCL